MHQKDLEGLNAAIKNRNGTLVIQYTSFHEAMAQIPKMDWVTRFSIEFDAWSPNDYENTCLVHALVEKFPKLESLSFKGAYVTGLNELILHSGIKALELDDCKVDNLGGLKSNQWLKSIRIRHLELDHLCYLDPFFNLETICIEDLPNLKSLDRVDYFKKLTYLKVTKCDDLEDFCGLSSVASIRFLDLSSNCNLFDINFLSKIYGLRDLNLGHCEALEDISPLEGLVNLESISFAGCRSVKDLEAISHLGKLQNLHLEGTGIETLEQLRALKRLRFVNCTGTKITSLEPIRWQIEKRMLVSIESNPDSVVVGGTMLVDPPLEICGHGKEAVIQYWRRMNRGALIRNPLNTFVFAIGLSSIVFCVWLAFFGKFFDAYKLYDNEDGFILEGESLIRHFSKHGREYASVTYFDEESMWGIIEILIVLAHLPIALIIKTNLFSLFWKDSKWLKHNLAMKESLRYEKGLVVIPLLVYGLMGCILWWIKFSKLFNGQGWDSGYMVPIAFFTTACLYYLRIMWLEGILRRR
jgi:hypothetical protein